MFRHIFLLVPAQAVVAEFLATFNEFPPRQKAASFSLDQVIEKMTKASGGGGHWSRRPPSLTVLINFTSLLSKAARATVGTSSGYWRT
jgi:hypothetical protein